MCYNSEGEKFPSKSITTLLWQRKFSPKCYISEGKGIPWQSEAKEYHKVTLYNTLHIRDLLGGENPGEWLPQLRREAAENWVEDRVYIAFPSFQGGDWWDLKSWDLAFASVEISLGSPIRAARVSCGWNLVVGCPQGRILATYNIYF